MPHQVIQPDTEYYYEDTIDLEDLYPDAFGSTDSTNPTISTNIVDCPICAPQGDDPPESFSETEDLQESDFLYYLF